MYAAPVTCTISNWLISEGIQSNQRHNVLIIELVGMVSMDEEGNGVIPFESMQLTKWGLISAWSNLTLVTSAPFAKEVSTATANSPQSIPPFCFPIFIRLTMTGGRKPPVTVKLQTRYLHPGYRTGSHKHLLQQDDNQL